MALQVFAFAFDQPDKGVNCTTLAQTLASCLLSLGVAARPVGIYPFAPYDSDNHFVTEVWCPELAQWVMLDPTVNTYVMDAAGHPLDCLGIRECLADQRDLRFSDGLHYNGQPYAAQEHRDYLAKDLFVLQCPFVARYNSRETGWGWVCPEGFDNKRRAVLNVEWRIQQYGNSEWAQEWLSNVKAAPQRYLSPEALRQAP